MAQHGRSVHRPCRPPRSRRRVGLLDLLLRQLPPRPRRATARGSALPRCADDHRRALAEVRARGGPRRARRSRRAVCRPPPRARRPRADDVAGLHRPRVADAGRRRPRGLRRRLDVRRGPRPRSRRPRRRAHRGAHGQGHPPARRRPLRAAADGRHGAALPRQGRCPAGRVGRRVRHREPPGRAPRVRPRDRASALGRPGRLLRAAGRPARYARGGRPHRLRPRGGRLGQPSAQGNPHLRQHDPRRGRHRRAAA